MTLIFHLATESLTPKLLLVSILSSYTLIERVSSFWNAFFKSRRKSLVAHYFEWLQMRGRLGAGC